MQGANRVATEIEVQDDSKGGAAPAAPGAPGGAPREPGGREPGGAPGDRSNNPNMPLESGTEKSPTPRPIEKTTEVMS